MENEQFNITFAEGQKEVTILKGEAPMPIKPKSLSVAGTIDAPLRFLEKRDPELKIAHILVDRESMIIKLSVNENIELNDVIIGALKITDEFKAWKINSGESWNHRELALFVKMNRANFENRDLSIKLSDQLQNLKVKAEKVLENEQDKRGNRRILIQQAIKEMNLPEKFSISVPLFKGSKNVNIDVEIYIDPDDYSCTLISPDASESIRRTRDETIDNVLDQIKEIKPELVIMEV